MSGIEEDIKRWLATGRQPENISKRIERKYSLLWDTYNIRFDPIARSLASNPELYNQIDEIEELRLFFRRPIEIALAKLGCSNTIWCREESRWIDVARYPDRLLIRNPLTDQIESWARFSSESKTVYTVHHAIAKGLSQKSKFCGGYDFIEPIELAILENGIGELVSEDTMRLYGNFDQDIGKAATGESVSFACLEIKRRPRTPTKLKSGKVRKNGNMLWGHAYPARMVDLQRDFAGTSLQVNAVPLLNLD